MAVGIGHHEVDARSVARDALRHLHAARGEIAAQAFGVVGLERNVVEAVLVRREPRNQLDVLARVHRHPAQPEEVLVECPRRGEAADAEADVGDAQDGRTGGRLRREKGGQRGPGREAVHEPTLYTRFRFAPTAARMGPAEEAMEYRRLGRTDMTVS